MHIKCLALCSNQYILVIIIMTLTLNKSRPATKGVKGTESIQNIWEKVNV